MFDFLFKKSCDRRTSHEEILHQRAMDLLTLQMEMRTKELETIFASLAERDKTNSEAVMEMAKGSQEMAKAFGVWLQMFQTTQVPQVSIVREEDEMKAEYERLKQAGFPVELPEEFRLAWTMEQIERAAELS